MKDSSFHTQSASANTSQSVPLPKMKLLDRSKIMDLMLFPQNCKKMVIKNKYFFSKRFFKAYRSIQYRSGLSCDQRCELLIHLFTLWKCFHSRISSRSSPQNASGQSWSKYLAKRINLARFLFHDLGKPPPYCKRGVL